LKWVILTAEICIGDIRRVSNLLLVELVLLLVGLELLERSVIAAGCAGCGRRLAS
jgi:hypothetical protein